MVDRVVKRFEAMKRRRETVAGSPITSLVTVNGVRVGTPDGTWCPCPPSSNKPELVVVVDTPSPSSACATCSKAVDTVLRENPEVGAYNQTI